MMEDFDQNKDGQLSAKEVSKYIRSLEIENKKTAYSTFPVNKFSVLVLIFCY